MRGRKPFEMAGKKFGRLTVIAFHSERGKHIRLWTCKCDCGNVKAFIGAQLRNGKTTSCGCFRIEQKRAQMKVQGFKHGLSGTYFSQTWEDMTSRCYNKNHKHYRRYGGRGIKICEAIRTTPESIKRLIGERPEKHTIDRTNNSGNYSCGQCSECLSNGWEMNIRWATRYQQIHNRG